MAIVLTERDIPPSSYGYWILPSGDCLPVADQKHAAVACDWLSSQGIPTDTDWRRYDLMFGQGAIRVTMTNAVYTGELTVAFQCDLNRITVDSINSLIQIIRIEDPDLVTKDFWQSDPTWTQSKSRALIALNDIKQARRRSRDLTEAKKPNNISDWSEEEQIDWVTREWPNVRDLPKPIPINIQIAAVKASPFALYYLPDAPGLVQFIAVSKLCDNRDYNDEDSKAVIHQIKTLDPSLQLMIVEKRPKLFSAIRKPTKEARDLYKQSTKLSESNEYNSNDPNNWSEAKQIEFVKQNYENIKRIKHLSEAVQLAAVQENGWAIKYITNPTILVQLAAVKNNGIALFYIKNPTIPVQLAAVQQYGMSIQWITNPLPMIQWAACKQLSGAINEINPIESIDISLLKTYRDILNANRLAWLNKIESENLTESRVGQYGAWVLETGQVVPVNIRWGHNEALDEFPQYQHWLNPTVGALAKGAIRVVYWPGKLEIEWCKPTQAALTNFYEQLLIPNRSTIFNVDLTRYRDPEELGSNLNPETRTMDSEKFINWVARLAKKYDAMQTVLESNRVIDDQSFFINDWSEAKQIDAVSSAEWTLINLIDSPSEAVQLAAVRTYGRAIQCIKNPTIPVQLAAVQQDPSALQFIYNPPPLIQWTACNKEPESIGYIKPPTSTEVSLLRNARSEYLTMGQLVYLKSLNDKLTESTKYDPNDHWNDDPNSWSEERLIKWVTGHLRNIEMIDNPSEAVQLSAVQSDWKSIQFIKNPTVLVQLAAVQENGWAIYYIKNPDLPVQLAAVQQNGNAIEFITNPRIEVQMAAVQQNGWAIEYIKNPRLEVQLAAVQQNGLAICYIKNPTPLIQTAACFQNPKAINEIDPIESTNISLMKKYRDELDAERLAYLEQIENETLIESITSEIYQLPKGTYGGWITANGEFIKVGRMFEHETIAKDQGYSRNYDMLQAGAIRLIFGGTITNQLQIEMHQPSNQAKKELINLIRSIEFKEIKIEYQTNNRRKSESFDCRNTANKQKLRDLLASL